jgi:hypothetical protein
LRLRGFDVAHAQELQRKGRSDAEQLQHAASEGRCLVTYNVKDFVLLHREYTASGRSHCGLVVSKQLPLRETPVASTGTWPSSPSGQAPRG